MLEVSNLNQYYGSSLTLRDVAFNLQPGRCTALLGRNGVGKSTLLKCLMGVVPVASGKIALDGEAATVGCGGDGDAAAVDRARARRHAPSRMQAATDIMDYISSAASSRMQALCVLAARCHRRAAHSLAR